MNSSTKALCLHLLREPPKVTGKTATYISCKTLPLNSYLGLRAWQKISLAQCKAQGPKCELFAGHVGAAFTVEKTTGVPFNQNPELSNQGQMVLKFTWKINAIDSTENSGNSRRKIKWNGNSLKYFFETLGIPPEVIFFSGNSGKYCPICHWKFLEI